MWIKEESCKLEVTQQEFLLDITHTLPTPFFSSTMPEVQQSVTFRRIVSKYKPSFSLKTTFLHILLESAYAKKNIFGV